MIFLAEAFTRPKVMYRLAKLGFTPVLYLLYLAQHEARSSRSIFTELTQTEVREFFRPNLWPNTPDILTEVSAIRRPPGLHDPPGSGRDAGSQLRHLRTGLRASAKRAARARQRRVSQFGKIRDQTLGPGKSGQPERFYRPGQPDPPREPGAAERSQPAFHPVDNPSRLSAYSKQTRGSEQRHRRRGQSRSAPCPVGLGRSSPSEELGLDAATSLSDARSADAAPAISGMAQRNYVQLDPQQRAGPDLPRAPSRPRASRTSIISCNDRMEPVASAKTRSRSRSRTIRSGTKTRSSTSSTSAPFTTATATASATSAG